ncbi:hypothetical protein Golob_002216, partial [Gossypium lobatum]|nr:hypothetical protein [Gossypium lobatum]
MYASNFWEGSGHNLWSLDRYELI